MKTGIAAGMMSKVCDCIAIHIISLGGSHHISVSARKCVEDYWQHVSINEQNYTLHCNGQDLVPDNMCLCQR